MINLFTPYFAKNKKLSEIESDMMKIASDYGIPDVKPITYYGLEGLTRRTLNGLYLGAYYYGNDNNYVGIGFSIRIDRKDPYDSDVMITRGIVVKDNLLVVQEDWR